MSLYSVRFPRVNPRLLDPARTPDPDPEPLRRGSPCPDCRGEDTWVYHDPDPREPDALICGDCLRESFHAVPPGAA